MNRREFVACGGGAAVALLGAGAWTALRPRTVTGDACAVGTRPCAAIFDSRFADSLRFGQGATRFGLSSWPIRGDVTELLLRQLRPLWARGEGALIGMTSAASLLCIQQIAADFWMRVVARVDHVPREDASVLVGPLVRALGRPAQRWNGRAVVVTRHSPAEPLVMPLVSWAIASRAEIRP